MKKLLSTITIVSCAMMVQAQSLPMDEFVTQLMGKMTLEEKLGQLNLLPGGDITTGAAMQTEVGSLTHKGMLGGIFNIKGVDKIRELQELAVKKSRLGIPLIVGMDVVHGYETIFPIPLALSCSWDMDAIEESARVAAKEASADGINWTYSPMVDIARDARWGRIAEGSGEDPFLGSECAKAMVRGYQGKADGSDMYGDKERIMACVKHFALYGASEAGRDYNTVDMSRQTMYNYYLPPYKAAVEAGVGSVMSSFNIIDYVPATANKWLLTDVLRNEWKFDGFVVTDYNSIGEIGIWGAGNLAKGSARALMAGTDMDMCSYGFLRTLAQSLKDGKVTEAQINQACRRVLEAKYKLGLFKDPYKYCDSKRVKKDIFISEHRAAARRIASECFVLLKNEDNILPLQKKGTIALIGPLADNRANMEGTWCVAAVHDKYPTLLEAMREAVGDKADILYAQGSNICRDAKLQEAGAFGKLTPRGDDDKMKDEALRIARQADVIVCAMGESAEMSGESSSRATLELFDVQHELLAALRELGKPIVLLNFAGRPTVLSWESKNISAIMNVWFGGSETGPAICDVLFGDKVPSGKLSVSMPQATGQEPLYYNHMNTGRPVKAGADRYYKYQSNYLEVRNDPLYPFGFGLSYTQFDYSDIRLSTTSMSKDGTLTASVTVKNTGGYDADEVVQLYIRDIESECVRPVKELKGFQRIHLAKGESKDVSFTITPALLSYYDYDCRLALEPGKFDIMIGTNSNDVKKSTIIVE
ncbi:MAG: beta-glucosidase BglX [Bacteroidaceae bacterium]|nr:beta-glucosidase BglX [Bacteroidaceae bacterium]